MHYCLGDLEGEAMVIRPPVRLYYKGSKDFRNPFRLNIKYIMYVL